MFNSSRQIAPSSDSGSAVVYDDAGSGILEACKTRFASSGCNITCDEKHTVWVKRADGTRSIGLSPWQLRQHSLGELLDNVESRLGLRPLAY